MENLTFSKNFNNLNEVEFIDFLDKKEVNDGSTTPEILKGVKNETDSKTWFSEFKTPYA